MVRPLTVQIIVIVFTALGMSTALLRTPSAVSTVVAESLAKEVDNKTSVDVNIQVKNLEARRSLRKKKKRRSTSSSSGERGRSYTDGTKESLELTETVSSSSEMFKVKKGLIPKSSVERRGWRKWHRKCPKCTEDMVKKWRDPTIKWICGAYQRARRSFKSECMMQYRNCQDGTMFVEIHKGRCNNDSRNDPRPHGDHFFYDYKVVLSGDSVSSSESSSYRESAEISY